MLELVSAMEKKIKHDRVARKAVHTGRWVVREGAAEKVIFK